MAIARAGDRIFMLIFIYVKKQAIAAHQFSSDITLELTDRTQHSTDRPEPFV
ncbi:hypothetical protein IQ270_11365 [Microcoleus sp. LEGE 07076]|uniref:hypothetical protein n=1 Tax=Microcoleus sp. LEGE 07076 TaxID=915322 RepID=UPI0018810891|nr:hypothetical protein [Microcoleus sp. LEGE 07076]MBE9185294.1 hypothetical protein [Microcoleus sp. LEGE 07076]